MKTKTITLRISPETARQLSELQEWWGETQSDAIRRCIEYVYRELQPKIDDYKSDQYTN